jgi:hypothetical protein
MVRFPAGMRDRLKTAAADNNRSMNAEIVSRLDRYDSLAGEVDALEVVARALADEIDEVCGEDPYFLHDKIGEVFVAVDEYGNVDKARLHRDWTAEVSRRLRGAMGGTVHLPDALLERVKAKAEQNKRTADAEILSTLEREYPAPSDVMHIHLDDIRHALDLYERETDPQRRLYLQTTVEHLVTSGHAMSIDWADEGADEE